MTYGSEDLHLKSTSQLIDAGTDLGTGSFSYDIDNYDRDAGGVVWDIGADEYVSTSTAVGKVIMIYD